MTKHIAFALASTLLLSACAGASAPAIPTAATPADACVTAGTWADPATGHSLPPAAVLARASQSNAVLLGETHVIADHHRWQLQVLSQLHARRPDLVLGLEAFPRRVQPVLDRWVAGELSEQAFLHESGWHSEWRFDPALYMPLFHFARLNRVPMVALNVERALVSRVSQDGWAAIPQSDRLGLGDPAPAQPGYVKMLSDVYGKHGPEDTPNGTPEDTDPAFQRFVEVQTLWDRAMAEAIRDALGARGPDALLVGIVGRGHLDYGYGIPYQLHAMGIDRTLVLVPQDLNQGCGPATDRPAIADAVFGLDAASPALSDHGKPKLGIAITADENGGVKILEVGKDSLAETAQLQADDIIVQAAGTAIADTGALIEIVQRQAPGTWLPLQIRRGGKTLEIIARFPPKPANHPTQP